MTSTATRPTVTVLIPVRNCERFLPECIKSVLEQSFQDFELVIVNDGSTDRSVEVCSIFEDTRIRLVANTGEHSITNALNLGISLARGKYIARIDCDDLMMPERLEKQVLFLESHPNVGLVGSWMRTFGDRSSVRKYPVANSDIQLYMLFGSPFGHPSVMFRTEWLDGDKGYYDPHFNLAEDFELWTRISQSWECANIPEILTHYRTHPSQITKVALRDRAECATEIVEKYHAQIGVDPMRPNPTIKDFRAWWRQIESGAGSTKSFESADLARLKTLQMKLLLKKRLIAYLSNRGALSVILKVRNFIEKNVRLGSRN